MINALIKLGVYILGLDNTTIKIIGCGVKFDNIDIDTQIHFFNSVTTSGFVISVLWLLPGNSSVILEGDKRLNKRPIQPL